MMTTAVLVPALTSAAGVGLLLLSIRAFIRARGSTNWSSAPGRVTAFDPPRPMSRFDAPYVVAFGLRKPDVTYSYEVQGVRYHASAVSFGPDSDIDRNQRRAEQYAVGSTIKVFYNPHRPSQAVLEPGLTRLIFYQVVLALVLIGLGIYLLGRP